MSTNASNNTTKNSKVNIFASDDATKKNSSVNTIASDDATKKNSSVNTAASDDTLTFIKPTNSASKVKSNTLSNTNITQNMSQNVSQTLSQKYTSNVSANGGQNTAKKGSNDSNRKISDFENFTVYIGDALIPKKFRRQIQDYLSRASIYSVPYMRFGLMVYISVILSIVLDVLLLSTKAFSGAGFVGKFFCSIIFIPLLFLAVIFLTTKIFKLYLDVKIQVKTNQMKECFPEFLSNMALNLRIGGTLDVALENSADKELGYLSDEIKIVVRNIRLGTTEDVAIKDFMKKYDIDVINDTFELMMISWRKGGNTANLTEKIYENMKASRFLRDKIIASATNYRIFLTALAVVIAPAMFAMTFHLIDLIRRISKITANIPQNTSLPLKLNTIKINDAHFILFSTLCVLLIAVSIAFIISVVKTGEAKHAYKQIILYAIISFVSFQLFMILFKAFFAMFAV